LFSHNAMTIKGDSGEVLKRFEHLVKPPNEPSPIISCGEHTLARSLDGKRKGRFVESDCGPDKQIYAPATRHASPKKRRRITPFSIISFKHEHEMFVNCVNCRR